MSTQDKVKVYRMDHFPREIGLPDYKTDGAAAVDLFSTEKVLIDPGSMDTIRTGIRIAMPWGMCGLILPRSSAAFNGLVLANTVGLVDPDYRGEIKIALQNNSYSTRVIDRGDRVAQLLFLQFSRVGWELTDKLPNTNRWDGGFGSTGIK